MPTPFPSALGGLTRGLQAGAQLGLQVEAGRRQRKAQELQQDLAVAEMDFKLLDEAKVPEVRLAHLNNINHLRNKMLMGKPDQQLPDFTLEDLEDPLTNDLIATIRRIKASKGTPEQQLHEINVAWTLNRIKAGDNAEVGKTLRTQVANQAAKKLQEQKEFRRLNAMTSTELTTVRGQIEGAMELTTPNSPARVELERKLQIIDGALAGRGLEGFDKGTDPAGELRQKAIAAIQAAGYPIDEANIQAAMEQLGDESAVEE